ncbi:hypothetical protein GCM10011376_26500 [Nocardioides flavus (ex Wang et al. 2016)]|uniref:Uncharacterized protein n=1 Tax=Nocardioides flavus (ex Wang et al. 2016) TaxID=2058780 RepID=A0ABQ3HM85_9ACTN|nr:MULTISPECIES: hypothetical protein [Nocardioides]GHE18040.1 hypothetical protein GCM10011376_26500 [Nocardioides flavus (ex Wang et al. 2016)]
MREAAPSVRRRGREFPVLGSADLAPSPSTLTDFFATTPERRAFVDGEGRLTGTTGRIHAKAMGTGTTVCGRNASSWVKFWEVPFSTILVKACPDCLEGVREY